MSSFKHLLSKKTWKILSYHGSFHVFDRWLIYSCCVSLERQLHSNTEVKMIIYWLRWKWRDANDRKLLTPDEKIYSVYPYKQNLLFRNLLLLSATSLATLTYLSSSQSIESIVKCTLSKLREFDSLWQKANTWKVSYKSSLRWPIYIIILVDKTKLSCNNLHWRSITVSVLAHKKLRSK